MAGGRWGWGLKHGQQSPVTIETRPSTRLSIALGAPAACGKKEKKKKEKRKKGMVSMVITQELEDIKDGLPEPKQAVNTHVEKVGR